MTGFPAHAGMDLSSPSGRAPSGGFPRPRGDGPSQHVIVSAPCRVSPPTRGWTRHHGSRRHRDRGFPAHAGMDRTSTWRGICSRRFPRPRGDGPMPRTLGVTDPAVSPPTRGWTPSAESLVPRVPGFPAHAGMDPRCRPSTRSASRFPRPRGDGPKAFTATQAGTGVSPPTRGWTRPGDRRIGY